MVKTLTLFVGVLFVFVLIIKKLLIMGVFFYRDDNFLLLKRVQSVEVAYFLKDICSIVFCADRWTRQ